MANSPDCGYVPCDPAGIEKRRYCEGKNQYAEYTDGNCGVTRQLIMANSPDCGYTPLEPATRIVDFWWDKGFVLPGIITMPFKLPESSGGTALVIFDPDGTTWVKPTPTRGPAGSSGNLAIGFLFLCSESLGVWEGVATQSLTSREKGYVFPKGAISQAMKTAPDLFAVQLYQRRDLGS